MRHITIGLCVTAMLALPAFASPTISAMVGGWTISRTSEWPDACSIVLQPAPAIGGYSVRLRRGCQAAFGWTGDIMAWRFGPDGSLVLADGTRHGVIHFAPLDDGDWVGRGPDGQDYVITRDKTHHKAGRK